MTRTDGATIASGAALALALIAMLWLALWPNSYQGVATTAVQVVPGSSQHNTPVLLERQTRATASLIETNGVWVISLLLFPVALTAIGLLSAVRRHTARNRVTWRLWRTSGWASAILLLLFCVAGAFSVGLFYVPAALGSIVGAVLGARRHQVEA